MVPKHSPTANHFEPICSYLIETFFSLNPSAKNVEFEKFSRSFAKGWPDQDVTMVQCSSRNRHLQSQAPESTGGTSTRIGTHTTGNSSSCTCCDACGKLLA